MTGLYAYSTSDELYDLKQGTRVESNKRYYTLNVNEQRKLVTVSVLRAVLNHVLYNKSLPTKEEMDSEDAKLLETKSNQVTHEEEPVVINVLRITGKTFVFNEVSITL